VLGDLQAFSDEMGLLAASMFASSSSQSTAA